MPKLKSWTFFDFLKTVTWEFHRICAYLLYQTFDSLSLVIIISNVRCSMPHIITWSSNPIPSIHCATSIWDGVFAQNYKNSLSETPSSPCRCAACRLIGRSDDGEGCLLLCPSASYFSFLVFKSWLVGDTFNTFQLLWHFFEQPNDERKSQACKG